MNSFLEVQLARASTRLPSGSDWTFEEKFDGHRAQIVKNERGMTVFSRNGHNRTQLYSSLLPAFERISAESFVLDGEICAFDAAGRSDFSLLCQRLGSGQLKFVAFDCLEVNGHNLVDEPLRARRAALVHLVPPNAGALTVARQVPDGEALFSEVRTGGGEGIVAKRLEAPYHSGSRSPDWLKIKCLKRQEFAVIGWHEDDQARLQSLVLGTYSADGNLEFRGCVGAGFSQQQRISVLGELTRSRRALPPFLGRVRVRRDVRWVEPTMVAEVQYGEIAASGSVRHPTFLGLRLDKTPVEVHLEA